MLKIPDKGEFPGTGEKGNGIAENLKSQGEWLNVVKTNGCITCHQLGNKATRTIPKELGEFKSSAEAWARRIVSGQAMTTMLTRIKELGPNKSVGLWADWTDRIAAGELPKSKPPRPQGVERNVVITLWDWSRPTAYLHDEISSDKRNPTINANGPIYGATEFSTDFVPVLDPVKNKATEIKHPVRDPKTPSAKTDPMSPSPYWGTEPIWDSQSNHHNPMLDEKGRAWFTARVRPPENPEFCKQGSDHPSAKIFPLNSAKDKRVVIGYYDVAVSPIDGSVWGSSLGFPGYIARFDPGPNPAETGLTEIYEPPVALNGYGVRGMDIDRNGVVWVSLSSGHLGSFDRRKCKVLNGPTATGKHCPEGWTLYPFPGPQFENLTDSGSVESSYYTWVDQFDTFGLGKDVPIATGNLNDGLLALADGKFVTLRVPYPLSFYAKWMDGRIDDPKV